MGRLSATECTYLPTYLCTPAPQALTRKRVVALLLGHSCLVVLCSPALSQGGQ